MDVSLHADLHKCENSEEYNPYSLPVVVYLFLLDLLREMQYNTS